jgi:hypothetical protein
VNHGFIDLRADPTLSENVSEALGKPGLIQLLKAVNARTSPVMTLGCENGIFDEKKDPEGKTILYVGSYLDVCYRAPRVSTSDNIIA